MTRAGRVWDAGPADQATRRTKAARESLNPGLDPLLKPLVRVGYHAISCHPTLRTPRHVVLPSALARGYICVLCPLTPSQGYCTSPGLLVALPSIRSTRLDLVAKSSAILHPPSKHWDFRSCALSSSIYNTVGVLQSPSSCCAVPMLQYWPAVLNWLLSYPQHHENHPHMRPKIQKIFINAL